MPAVVMGLYADCVLRLREGSGVGRGEEGVGSGLGSIGGISAEGRSRVKGEPSSLMLRSSVLRLLCLSSSASGSVLFSKARA